MASFRVLYTLLRIYDNMFYVKKIIKFYIKYLSTWYFLLSTLLLFQCKGPSCGTDKGLSLSQNPDQKVVY